MLNNLKKMTDSMGEKGLKQIEVANQAHSVSFRKFKTQDWNRLICRSLSIARDDNTFIILKNRQKHLFT